VLKNGAMHILLNTMCVKMMWCTVFLVRFSSNGWILSPYECDIRKMVWFEVFLSAMFVEWWGLKS